MQTIVKRRVKLWCNRKDLRTVDITRMITYNNIGPLCEITKQRTRKWPRKESLLQKHHTYVLIFKRLNAF